MNLLNDGWVKDYTLSSDEQSSLQFIELECIRCKCIYGNDNIPDVHDENANPFSKNMAQLAADRKSNLIRSIIMYITNTCYLDGDTMKFLINKMLECDKVETVEQYYCVVNHNLSVHPPCASYMQSEYEQLFLTTYQKCFQEMTLWNYLLECFDEIINEDLLDGKNIAYELAFKKCLKFCVLILRMDFDLSKKNNYTPLIMKCLNYDPEKKTRLSDILKTLNKMFKKMGPDFKTVIVNLVVLIEEMRQNTNV